LIGLRYNKLGVCGTTYPVRLPRMCSLGAVWTGLGSKLIGSELEGAGLARHCPLVDF
jgi:hypothetical protein